MSNHVDNSSSPVMPDKCPNSHHGHGDHELFTATAHNKGLRSNALGLASSIVISIASAGPALVFAALFGVIVSYMGLNSPGMLMLAAVPVILVALSYRELNSVEPDCGTAFVWVGHSIGPKTGFMAGWALFCSSLVVMPASAYIAATYLYSLVGLEELSQQTVPVVLLGLVVIGLGTYLCYRGVELVAWMQKILVAVELGLLVTLLVVGAYHVITGDVMEGAHEFDLSWFNPFTGDTPAFISAFTVAIFAYWGWDIAFTLTEETENGQENAAKSGFASLGVTTLLYATGMAIILAYAGGDYMQQNSEVLLDALGIALLGPWVTKLLVLCVFSSILAATQATLVPSSRQLFSMAAYRALPKALATVDKKYQTPVVATVAVGVISASLFVLLSFTSSNVLFDSLSATGMLVSFYYGMTTMACFWRFRKTTLDSARNFFVRGVAPLVASLVMFFAFIMTAINNIKPESSASSLWGIGGIFLLSAGTLLVGMLLMISLMRSRTDYFSGKTLNEQQ